MSIPLINIKAVRDFADLSVNVTERKYNQYILDAQNRFLKCLIGKTCLYELVDRKCTNTLTDDDKALMVYIEPYLVAYSYALYVGSSMKLSLNSGVATLSGDTATVIGQQSRVNESKRYVLSAESNVENIKTQLRDNPTLYPCFDDVCPCDEQYSHNTFFNL
jgi:hypothetical protein